MPDTAWMQAGACRSLDPAERDRVFFPPGGASQAEAKALCATCPVLLRCRDYALTNGERYGIWGGLSERQRCRIRRRRRLTQAA